MSPSCGMLGTNVRVMLPLLFLWWCLLMLRLDHPIDSLQPSIGIWKLRNFLKFLNVMLYYHTLFKSLSYILIVLSNYFHWYLTSMINSWNSSQYPSKLWHILNVFWKVFREFVYVNVWKALQLGACQLF